MIFSLLDRLSGFLKLLGGIALTSMMFLTLIDVIGRFFKHPIFGSVELVGFLATLTVAAALPYTYKMEGHVGVEIAVRLLPDKARLWVEIATRSLTLVLFGLITWQMFLYGHDIHTIGEVSMNLEFPLHYIVYMLALGLLIFSATILERIVDTVKQLRKLNKK